MSEDITAKIKKILDNTPCYLLYNTKTFEPVSSSGNIFTEVSEGFAQTTISYHTHKNLIESPIRIDRYFVKLNKDEYAEIVPFTITEPPTVYTDSPNTIKDLDPKLKFFNYLGIPFSLIDDVLTVEFDTSTMTDDSVDYFIRVKQNNPLVYKLCITAYGNPNALHEIVELNVPKECTKHNFEYKLTNKYNKVSVWAIK